MSGVRAVWEQGRREPWLGALGLLGAVAAAMPVYLWVRQYRHLLGGEVPFVWDFSYYYEAAGRFLAAPLSLYADAEFFYPPPSVLLFLPWRAFSLPTAYLLSQVVIAVTAVLGLVLAESLAGVVTRLGQPLAVFDLREAATLGPGARAMTLGVALLGVGGLVALWLRDRLTTAAGVGLLALVPVVSPLGWEHIYTLALPLFALLAVRSAGPRARALVVLGVAVFFVPTLPQALMLASFEWWPRPRHDLIYARHLVATLGLLGFVTTREARRRTSAPAARAAGARRSYRGGS